jgi:hypothetical protein
MSEIERLWLHTFHPEDYNTWVRIEQAKFDRFRDAGLPDDKNLGVWGKKAIPEVLEKARERYGHLTPDDLQYYKMSHGHCVKSKY